MRESQSSSQNISRASPNSAVDNNISSAITSIHNLMPISSPAAPPDARINITNLRETLDADHSIYTISTQSSDSTSSVESLATSLANSIPQTIPDYVRPTVFSSTSAPYHNPVHLGTLPYFFHCDIKQIHRSVQIHTITVYLLSKLYLSYLRYQKHVTEVFTKHL